MLNVHETTFNIYKFLSLTKFLQVQSPPQTLWFQRITFSCSLVYKTYPLFE